MDSLMLIGRAADLWAKGSFNLPEYVDRFYEPIESSSLSVPVILGGGCFGDRLSTNSGLKLYLEIGSPLASNVRFAVDQEFVYIGKVPSTTLSGPEQL